jgi:hypothetical protein
MKLLFRFAACCAMAIALPLSVFAQATDVPAPVQRQLSDEEAALMEKQAAALVNPALTPEQRDALLRFQRAQIAALRQLQERQLRAQGAASQAPQLQLPAAKAVDAQRDVQRFTRERQAQQLEIEIKQQQQEYATEAQSRKYKY